MATLLGDLLVTIRGDQKPLNKAVDSAEKKSKDASQKIQKNFQQIGKTLSNVGRKLSMFITLPLMAIGAVAVKNAADFEKQKVAFETMLGSAKKAGKLLDQIEKFAATTPFQMPGLIEGAKRLLAFGTEAEDVIETMRRLGNAAMGDQNKLDSLTLAFGKLQAKGKATMLELNMFIQAGVPILDALAEQLDVTTQELFKMIETGQVGFEDVNTALTNLTTGTGRLAGLIEKQAETLSGLFSTLKDNLGLFAKDLGDILLPMLKNIVGRLIEWVQWFRTMGENTQKMIIIIAALAAAIGPLTMALGALINMLGFLAAHPVIAALIAIAAGIAAVSIALAAASDRRIEKGIGSIAEKLQAAADRGEDMVVAIRDMADATGLTVRQVTEIAEQEKIITEEIRKQLELAGEVVEEEEYATEEIVKQNLALKDFLGTAVNSGADAAKIARDWANNQDLALDRVIGIMETLKNMTPLQEQQLANLKEQRRAIADMEQDEAQLLELRMASAKAMMQQAAKGKELTVWQKAYHQALENIGTAYKDVNLQASIFGNEIDIVAEKQKIVREELDKLLEVEGFTALSPAVIHLKKVLEDLIAVEQGQQAAEKQFADRRQREHDATLEQIIAEREERQKSLQERIDQHWQAQDIEQGAADLLYNLTHTRIEQLKRERDKKIALAEEAGAKTYAIEAYYAGLIADERIAQAERAAEERKAIEAAFFQFLADAANLIGQIFSTLAQTRMAARMAELEAHYGELSSEEQAYQDYLAEKDQDRYDALSDEEKREEDLKVAAQKAEQNRMAAMEKEKKKLIREEAKRQKAAAVFGAIISTALAIIRMLADPGGIVGAVMAVLAGITGALQIAAIAAQPLPSLAKGGVLEEDQDIKAHKKELITPLDDNFFRRFADSLLEALGERINGGARPREGTLTESAAAAAGRVGAGPGISGKVFLVLENGEQLDAHIEREIENRNIKIRERDLVLE